MALVHIRTAEMHLISLSESSKRHIAMSIHPIYTFTSSKSRQMHKTPELFDGRWEKKKSLEFRDNPSFLVDVWSIWRYYEWVNIWNEISKDGQYMRPCVVLQNNRWNGLYLVMPLTTKYHAWMEKYYFIIHNPEKYGIVWWRGIINQIHPIDKKRFINKLSLQKISISMVDKILQAYRNL